MKSYTIDEAVRDITKVGVCPAPKSKVREIVLQALHSFAKASVESILEEVPRKDLLEVKPKLVSQDGLILRKYGEADGWNSCRETMIAKAIQLGVMEKDV